MTSSPKGLPRRLAPVTLALASLLTAGCGGPLPHSSNKIAAVGAESQYADVLRQIGGRYVSVSSILSNPNTDPHTFEASSRVAAEISRAQLIVQNGLGYDSFMNKLEAASTNGRRRVVVAQKVLGVSPTTGNPHLWYSPRTMPAVAKALAANLSRLAPAHHRYFEARLRRFDASLRPWMVTIASFRRSHGGSPVETTEPVADYLLEAMGLRDMTPFRFQADVMNGVDPAPEDMALVRQLLTRHRVKALCYNDQVVDPLTASLRQAALRTGVAVVALYETMPTPGYDYQSWMLAETQDVARAVVDHKSSQHL